MDLRQAIGWGRGRMQFVSIPVVVAGSGVLVYVDGRGVQLGKTKMKISKADHFSSNGI